MTKDELVLKIDEFKNMQKDIQTLAAQLDMAKRHYQEKVHAFFGLANGQIELVNLFETIIKLTDFDKTIKHG